MTKLSFVPYPVSERLCSPGAMRVLIVEDEPRIVDFVRTALESEGALVDVAGDGVVGLELALVNEYDLVVLDELLPHSDGLTVLSQLREDKPHVPVLILSARSDLPARLRRFELGATDYVAKPFEPEELLARVRAQLERAARQDPDAPAGGGLVLDVLRRQVRVDGLVIALSDREFTVLHHLITRAGQVVSREQLLAEVWGIDFNPGTNVVDVYVRRLRKKLGVNSPIETVRNAGYRVPVESGAMLASPR